MVLSKRNGWTVRAPEVIRPEMDNAIGLKPLIRGTVRAPEVIRPEMDNAIGLKPLIRGRVHASLE